MISDPSDALSRESLWLIHVMYVTIVASLMLNFLIAIFIDSYKEVANNPEVVTNVQWMAIMATIDFRIPRCMYPVVRRLKRSHFTYIDDRLFIKVYRTGTILDVFKHYNDINTKLQVVHSWLN